jgi:uncharacterized repeat protein (TIGR03803 family)
LAIDAKGNLYGTTSAGGANSKGTVFELTPSAGGTWTEKVLYSFGATSTDGTGPLADRVLDSKGNLYGTTQTGGTNSAGTAFELSLGAGGTWTETLLWNFTPTTGDGGTPNAGMILDTEGNLYGTTQEGGSIGDGTVFELTPAGGVWTEKILHSFSPSSADGVQPLADLVMDSKGNLYGTTPNGGAKAAGAAFELTPGSSGSWTFKQIYSFHAFTGDSESPYAGLIVDAVGNLYGTAETGGVSSLGTVYELTPTTNGSWTEKIPYSFSPYNNDGTGPISRPLLDADGNLFGTPSAGGSGHYYGYGGGTVFEIPSTVTAVPQFSPAGGSYVTPQTVTITDGTPNATTYYTTDGTTPTTASTKYSSPISVSATETIKAFAVASGYTDSAVASATYTITLTAAAPLFSPPGGTYTGPQSVTITDTTADSTIYYAIAPSTSFIQYTEPITVSSTETIEAFAVASGYADSATTSTAYTIKPFPPGALQFVPVTPCRIADTRNATGALAALNSPQP